MYLIDTCVISELIKPKPNQKIISWLNSQEEETLCLSVVTIGEIQRGVSKLEPNNKQKAIEKWLNEDLINRFESRILSLDLKVLLKWGQISGNLAKRGITLPLMDGLIGATAIVGNLKVVTLNERGFEEIGCEVVGV